MATKPDKPWEPAWERIEMLGSGGQGHTYTVRSRTDQNKTGVLKLLVPRKESDPQARRRMHREVTNLKTLKDAGGDVPTVFDGNTQLYGDVGVKLYFIMEHIKGKTFSERSELRSSRESFTETSSLKT